MSNGDYLSIREAREHNLQGINLDLPKNKLIVFTGLSGSGKSSLAFDTIYAEGQRRYVESLSSYARQFLGVMPKPKMESITGLSPAISIDQKTTSHNPRSTVGTITEIHDGLRLLFARIGRPHDPTTGEEVIPFSIDQILALAIDLITEASATGPVRLAILAPLIKERKGEYQQLFGSLKRQGYAQAFVDGHFHNLDEEILLLKNNKHTIEAITDRLTIAAVQLNDEQEKLELRQRLSHAFEQALAIAAGSARLLIIQDPGFDWPTHPQKFIAREFSEKRVYPSTGQPVPELEPRLFSFNTPFGACPQCDGLGTILSIDADRIVAPSLTLPEGAIIPFARTLEGDTWFARTIQTIVEAEGGQWKDAWQDYPPTLQNLLLHGSKKVYTIHGENRFQHRTSIEESFEGFLPLLERRYRETTSEYMRQEIERYMQKNTCPACQGQRLRPESLAVSVGGVTIAEVSSLSIRATREWIADLHNDKSLSTSEQTILAPIQKELVARLDFLVAVGLDYLTLDREANTLAGGEAQRIRLASQIGSGLSGVLYVLDEPTIGLHNRDNMRLIQTLQRLRDLGNTVIVVEHDRDVMLAADQIVDFGPGAGQHGGKVVAQCSPQELMTNKESLTGAYLANRKKVQLPSRNIPQHLEEKHLTVHGAREHNLKNITVSFPLHRLVCLTGVSGSGKSTLLHDTLARNVLLQQGRVVTERPGKIDHLEGLENIDRLVIIDQAPIGRTPRSNPATYTKVFDIIRELFATSRDAKEKGFKTGRFSFNVKGGRCEACQGEGQVKVEMQFLPDIYVNCDVCHGKRYNQETLEATYHDKTIADVLDMTIEQAAEFFTHSRRIKDKLQTMIDVGLGYIKMGQPAPTLSGGEAQRVKLARELYTATSMHTLYLLDEPTTGLHFEDVQKLLLVLHKLIEQGNSVIMIEHNLDVIKNADHIIELGPEGGDEGGYLLSSENS